MNEKVEAGMQTLAKPVVAVTDIATQTVKKFKFITSDGNVFPPFAAIIAGFLALNLHMSMSARANDLLNKDQKPIIGWSIFGTSALLSTLLGLSLYHMMAKARVNN